MPLPRLLRQLQGSALIAAHLRERRVPYLDRSRIEKKRDQRVRQIVRHAAQHVPFYREHFEREGLDPRAIRTATELTLLPRLDREQVRREPHRFLSENAVGTLPLLTSGSTGTPLEVHHDRSSVLTNIAYGERERAAVIALTGAGFRPRELYVGYETSNFVKVLEFTAANARMPVRPRRASVSMTAPFAEIVAAVEKQEPDILTAYGTFVDEFFRRLGAESRRIRLPKVVMYVGETLPAERRTAIENEFGVAVVSRYCAVEAFKIAFYCEHRTGFHLHEDLCHVRVERPDRRDAAPGETGEIVLSNLVNTGTVLLNYPMGDLAVPAEAPCTCGRTFRMLSRIEGRVEDLLELPGGDSMHPRAIWAAFKDDRDVLQYQLTQESLRRFRLKLVTRSPDAFAKAAERAEHQLRSILGADIDLEARFEPELGKIEREQRGKFRAVANHVRSPSAGR